MVSINFLGDVALFKLFEEKGIDPIKDVNLPQSDYNIGNFEFIIPNRRDKYFFDVSDDYKLSYEYFKTLNLKRFNAFSLANNHCLDYGIDGVKDVLEILNRNNIQNFGFGESNFNLLVFNIKEVSFVVIACVKKGRWSKNKNQPTGPDLYDFDAIASEIKKLKQKYDHVILFPHWGTELVDVPDPKDIKNARAFIDCGASAVIGHHPHIIQGIERYKKGIIAYSLGSFIYVPEKEVGYSTSQGKKRNYSICLSLYLDKHEVKDFKPYFYEYCENGFVPKLTDNRDVINYFQEINNRINKKGEYVKKVRKILIAREVKSFIQRFKSAPVKTLIHYLNYIKVDHFKKLFK